LLGTIVYGYLSDLGGGKLSVSWYLTEVDANEFRKYGVEFYNEFTHSNIVAAETFIGSNIYEEAVKNSDELNEEDEVE
jgi:hypothetical protein